MLVIDKQVGDLIISIGRHYNDNISTRFLRPVFVQILSDIDLSRHISNLTEYSADLALQGFHLDDLYCDILALSRFIYRVKREVLPDIHSLTELHTKTASEEDKVYRSMAFNNLGPNLHILANMLLELYNAATAYDKSHTVKGKTVAQKIEGLSDISRLLGNE